MHPTDTLARLGRILVEHFGKRPEQLDERASLRGTLMLDSLDLVDLLFFINREFVIDAEMEGCREVRSLGELAVWVDGHERRAA